MKKENLSEAIKKYRGVVEVEEIKTTKTKNNMKYKENKVIVIKIDDNIIAIVNNPKDIQYEFTNEGKLKYFIIGERDITEGFKKGFALINIYCENLRVYDGNSINEDANPRDGYIMISFEALTSEDFKKLEEYGIRVMFDDDKNLRCIEDTHRGYFYGYSKTGDLHIFNTDRYLYTYAVVPEASYDKVFYDFFKKYHGEKLANEIRDCLLSKV